MEIHDLNVFLDYFDKIHKRTVRVVRCISSGQSRLVVSRRQIHTRRLGAAHRRCQSLHLRRNPRGQAEPIRRLRPAIGSQL